MISSCRCFVLALAVATVLTGSACGQFVVNEVLANEPSDSVRLEWFELYNNSDNAINSLSFYTVDVSSFSDTSTVLLSGSIGAHEYLVICRDTVLFESRWGNNSGVWGDTTTEQYRLLQGSFRLVNDSGWVRLSRAGTPLSTLTWLSDAGNNVSWERVTPDGASILPSIDPSGSTPGRLNSRSALNVDLAIDDVLIGIDSGLTYLTFLLSNVGVARVDDPVLHVAYFDSTRADSMGTTIAVESPGPIDSGQTVFFATAYSLPGAYQRLIARLGQDDLLDNNVRVFTVPASAFPPVVINEFLANPEGALGSEWIELRNVSSDPVDLLGWQVGDSVGLSTISVLPLTIAAGGYVVLVQDEFGFSGYYGEFDGDIVEVSPWRSLNNGGDEVRLVDALGFGADKFAYSTAFDNNHTWGRGPTEDNVNRWGRSEDEGGTPGETNRVRFSNEGQSDLEVTVTPRVFSPNDDGYEDSTIIRVVAPQANGYTMKLYDSDGRLVKTFEDGAPDIASSYVWDGRDGGGRRLPIGIYVLFFEADGVQSVKQTIVVAR